MERRTVLIDGALLAAMFEDDTIHRGYRVVTGLPRDARLVGSHLNRQGQAALVFEGSFSPGAPEPFTPTLKVADVVDLGELEKRMAHKLALAARDAHVGSV